MRALERYPGLPPLCCALLAVSIACSGNDVDRARSGTGSAGAEPGGSSGTGAVSHDAGGRAMGGASGSVGTIGGGAADSSGGSASGGKNGAAGMGGTAGAAGAAGKGGAAGMSGGAGVSGGGGVVTTLPMCPGAPFPSGYPACRTQRDCPGASVCQLDGVTGCGACNPTPYLCQTDANCMNNTVCHWQAIFTPCPCSGQPLPPYAKTCAPRCGTCAAGFTCNASNGHCEPVSCTAGYACSAGLACVPSRMGADMHGCATALCTSDGYQCPSAFRCQAGASADVHGCSDISCMDGFTCPKNFDCDPSSQELHHCKRRACTSDADCDCGACIGTCQDRLFICSQLAP